jgi:hypothetical protein
MSTVEPAYEVFDPENPAHAELVREAAFAGWVNYSDDLAAFAWRALTIRRIVADAGDPAFRELVWDRIPTI